MKPAVTPQLVAYTWYRRGFSAGAAGSPKSVPAYHAEGMDVVWKEGYIAGVAARKKALFKAMRLLGYKPFRLHGLAPPRKNPRQIPIPF